MLQPKRTKVAVIGSGISGLSAAWALHQSREFEVHIYEALDRLGGHALTVPFRRGSKQVMVDAGFMVLNTATYRLFLSPSHSLLSYPLPSCPLPPRCLSPTLAHSPPLRSPPLPSPPLPSPPLPSAPLPSPPLPSPPLPLSSRSLARKDGVVAVVVV